MFEIKTATHTPENFIAGDYPIVKDAHPIKSGKTIEKFMPVLLTAGEIEPLVNVEEGTTDSLHGIAAEDGSGGLAVVYLTGEFFADSLKLPNGVTADNLKPAFRKLGIFLK